MTAPPLCHPLARPLFATITKNTGRQFVIDNKSGAGGTLGAQWVQLGTETPNRWGEQFGAFVASEVKRWAEVVKASGAKLD